MEKQLSEKVKIESYFDNSYLEMNSLQKHVFMPLKMLLFKGKIYNKFIKNKFDVEIAFLEGPITRIFSTTNKSAKKIVWVHNDISSVFGTGIKSKLKRIIDEKVYDKYKKIIFVSNENLKDFNKIYPNIKVEKKVIYNYINSSKILEKAEEKLELPFSKETTNFITVARLVEQKGIERLIEVHSKLIQDGFYHKFYIIGDGPLKEKLENKIKEEKVQDTFFLLGKKENPYPYVKNADYFCLFSHFEGYGMVLEEAKILNKPILITDTAAREAVRDYKNSKIAKNLNEGIYEILRETLENKEEKQFEKQKYDNKEIIKQIKKLLEEK